MLLRFNLAFIDKPFHSFREYPVEIAAGLCLFKLCSIYSAFLEIVNNLFYSVQNDFRLSSFIEFVIIIKVGFNVMDFNAV